MLKRMEQMFGYTVQAMDGNVGKVEDFYFDGCTWQVRYIIVDTGPWLFGRKVLLMPGIVEGVHTLEDVVAVALNQAQVENSPDVDVAKPVSEQQLEELHTYYGWPWHAPHVTSPVAYRPPNTMPPASIPAASPKTSPLPDALEKEVQAAMQGEHSQPGEPYLHSCQEVIGYEIQATDGEIGHVSDFLVDLSSWQIQYMLVDTGPWLLGKTVLFSTKWVEDLRWAQTEVAVNLSREEIENSPDYDPTQSVDREYEILLHRHYQRRGYWEA